MKPLGQARERSRVRRAVSPVLACSGLVEAVDVGRSYGAHKLIQPKALNAAFYRRRRLLYDDEETAADLYPYMLTAHAMSTFTYWISSVSDTAVTE